MDNYNTDSRVAANSGSMFKSLDLNRMTGMVEYSDWDADDNEHLHRVKMPIRWEVCSLCNGKGSHVNPNIDCNLLADWASGADPDFAEAYWRGDYDQTCNCCGGRTTEAVLDSDRLTYDQEQHLDNLKQRQQEEAENQRERDAELRMGC